MPNNLNAAQIQFHENALFFEVPLLIFFSYNNKKTLPPQKKF